MLKGNNLLNFRSDGSLVNGKNFNNLLNSENKLFFRNFGEMRDKLET